MEIVLETETPEGIVVVLPALVYAKVLEEHSTVADLDLIDRTIRQPTAAAPIRALAESGSCATRLACGFSP